MLQAIKIKLYPTEEQKTYINQLIGSNRFVHNNCLNYKLNEYKINSGYSNLTDTNNHVKQLKTQLPWLSESHSKVIQQTLINLETAYKNFFKNGSGFPNYKKKSNTMSVRFPVDAIMGVKGNRPFCKVGNAISSPFINKLDRRNRTFSISRIQLARHCIIFIEPLDNLVLYGHVACPNQLME